MSKFTDIYFFILKNFSCVNTYIKKNFRTLIPATKSCIRLDLILSIVCMDVKTWGGWHIWQKHIILNMFQPLQGKYSYFLILFWNRLGKKATVI
jgi:hypothetical protein